jgi:colicin import membrane protein
VELPASPPGEKLKPVVNQKGTEKVEAAKSRQKKAENVEKGWSLEKRKSSLRSLEEAMEDIDKKAALEEIRKKVARRENSARVSQELTVSGGGTGTGSGTGLGPAGSPSGGSPWGSSSGGSYSSLFDQYTEMILERVRKKWTVPRDLQGRTDLKTTISFTLDKEGRIQKMHVERSAGNAVFDESVKRALKKSEPLPPIPKEVNDDTFEITFRNEQ